MKVLFAATPVAGHLNPLLAVARMLLADGDHVIVATASYLEPAVSQAGARFLPLAPGADLDPRHVEEVWPERLALPPGPEQLRFDFERIFIDAMKPQAATLRSIIGDENPDVIVVDDFFFGATALFLDRRTSRPPIVAIAVTILGLDRPDGAPTMLGLRPADDDVTRARYAALAVESEAALHAPVRAYADAKLAELGVSPLPSSVLHSRHLKADTNLR